MLIADHGKGSFFFFRFVDFVAACDLVFFVETFEMGSSFHFAPESSAYHRQIYQTFFNPNIISCLTSSGSRVPFGRYLLADFFFILFSLVCSFFGYIDRQLLDDDRYVRSY